MHCDGCDKDMEDYFFMGLKICYQCQAKKKREETGDKKEKKVRQCRECKSELPPSRWVYCCEACSDVGTTKLKKDYWTNHV